MQVGAKSFANWMLPLLVLAACVFLLASGFGNIAAMVRGVESDTYQHIQPRVYRDTVANGSYRVRVLAADTASLDRFGRWPWSHSVLARLVEELNNAGATMVLFAFPLDTPDPATQAAAPDQPAASPSPDDALAAALSRLKTVTGFMLGDTGTRTPALKAEIEFAGSENGLATLPQFRDAAPALAKIEAASAGVGTLNLHPDPDGTIRSVPMLSNLGGRAVPSLEAEAMRLAGGASNLVARSEELGLPGVAAMPVMAGIAAGNLDVPLDAGGALQIYYSGPREERTVSAAALDEAQIAPGALKNAIVVVAPPVDVSTPAGMLPIGDVRAEALENVLLGEGLKTPSSQIPVLVFLLVAGLAIVVLFARAGALWAGAFAFLAIASAQGFSWLLFSRMHVLLDSASPNLALALVFFTGLVMRVSEIGRARAQLKGSFSDLLPVTAIEQIAHAPKLLKLDGETRTVTCLSCGIRGYRALAASFAEDPVGFTRLLNRAVAPMIEDAVSHGAMIGPFDGEFFAAYWNAPLDDAEHAIHACEAATRMTMSIAEVNEQLSHERRFDGTAFAPLEVGIGISTGPAIAGGLSSRGRTTYSVTGECTVLAGRIRALSGQYGPAIVVSEATREAASGGYAFLEVDFMSLAPKEPPVKLYAVLGNPLVRASPKFRALATFHEHIFQSLRAQQWEKTRELIQQCRKLSGASQKMYDLHLARIAWFEAHSPGPDWDGAFRPLLT